MRRYRGRVSADTRQRPLRGMGNGKLATEMRRNAKERTEGRSTECGSSKTSSSWLFFFFIWPLPNAHNLQISHVAHPRGTILSFSCLTLRALSAESRPAPAPKQVGVRAGGFPYTHNIVCMNSSISNSFSFHHCTLALPLCVCVGRRAFRRVFISIQCFSHVVNCIDPSHAHCLVTQLLSLDSSRLFFIV